MIYTTPRLSQKEFGLKNWWKELKYQRAKWTGKDYNEIGLGTMLNPFSSIKASWNKMFHPIEATKDGFRRIGALLSTGKRDYDA